MEPELLNCVTGPNLLIESLLLLRWKEFVLLEQGEMISVHATAMKFWTVLQQSWTG